MPDFDTDYLVIGAGATGLAFADTVLQETDAHITVVDRQALPGGQWNDAYPYVTLHQPSAFYGVNSLPLGSDRIDPIGPNAGLHELASGAEVCSYFQQVMQHRLLTGAATTVHVRRKVVDASHFTPEVPATTAPGFAVAAGVRLATPTQLARLGQDGHDLPDGYCIVGAGKTAMDAAMWLLAQGVPPAAIHWVMPRDSWIVNRLCTQPGEAFFMHSIGGMAQQMRALAEATDMDDLFLRLEAEKNALCTPVPFPRDLAGYVTATLVGAANPQRWNQDKTLRDWMRQTRLDGFGRLTSQVDRNDAEKMAVLAGVTY